MVAERKMLENLRLIGETFCRFCLIFRRFAPVFGNYYANSIYAFLQFALDLFLDYGIFRLFARYDLATKISPLISLLR